MIDPAPFARRALACVCALALVAPLSGAPSPAYPMVPQTLRDLVTDSDLVVWARVESNELLPRDPAQTSAVSEFRATLVVGKAGAEDEVIRVTELINALLIRGVVLSERLVGDPIERDGRQRAQHQRERGECHAGLRA